VSLHALDIHSLLRAAAPDDVPVVSVDDAVVTLVYLTPESYSARASDAATLAVIDGHPLIRGEMCAAGQTLRLVLWYGPQVAIAPPAPVSAKKK